MLLLPGHNDRVRGLAYAPDGRTLASCGSDWAVRVWDLVAGEERLTLRGHRRNIRGVAYSVDGRVIVSGGNEPTLRFWDAASGDLRLTLDQPIQSSDLREPGQWEVARLGGLLGDRPRADATDADLRAAEAAGWRVSGIIPRWLSRETPIERRDAIVQAITGTGREISIEGRDAILRDITARDGDGRESQLFEIGDGLAVSVPFTPRGTIRGTFVRGSGVGRASSTELDVAFSPDGRTLATSSLNDFLLWRIPERRLSTLRGHTDLAWALAFAPDGRTLATGGHDGALRLWDVATGDPLACLDGDVGIIDSVAFAPDGMTVAAGGKRGIVVWDVDEGSIR